MPLTQACSDSIMPALPSACPAQLHPHHPWPIRPVVPSPRLGAEMLPKAIQSAAPVPSGPSPALQSGASGSWLLGWKQPWPWDKRVWRQLVVDPQTQALGQAVVYVRLGALTTPISQCCLRVTGGWRERFSLRQDQLPLTTLRGGLYSSLLTAFLPQAHGCCRPNGI